MSPARFGAGALAAGMVSTASGILLAHFVLGDELRAFLERIGDLPAWAPFAHVAMRLGIGASALWIFLATREHIGGLLPSLLLAALVCWVLAYPIPLEIYLTLGGFGASSVALAGLWGYVEIVAAILAGWLVCGRPSPG